MTVLELDEAADVAVAYGVPDSQVRLDHLISHVLDAIASLELPLTFFGGTALARTYLQTPLRAADCRKTSISTARSGVRLPPCSMTGCPGYCVENSLAPAGIRRSPR